MAMMTARQVADRLGVKVETVYAYVSRGTLDSHRGRDGRTSMFRSADVEALARRGRPRRASATVFEVEIDTRITSIDERGLRFRGHDAVALATAATFEQVAELLWVGRLPAAHQSWTTARPPTIDAAVDAEPDPALAAIDRVRLVVAALGAADHLRNDLRPEAVAACGRSLIATIVESFPGADDGRSPRLVLPSSPRPVRGTIAGRLWAHLVPGRPKPDLVAVVNAALVLLIDHELAASTFAARSPRRPAPTPTPWSRPDWDRSRVRSTGAPAWRPGRSSTGRRPPAGVPRRRWRTLSRSTGSTPGSGTACIPTVTRGPSRSCGCCEERSARSRQMAVIDDVVASAQRRAPILPNSDFALAAIGFATGMPEASGDVIFTVARTAGWLAHALEEYQEQPLRFRPRARFVGPYSPQ